MHTSVGVDRLTLVELENDAYDLIALQYMGQRLRATLNQLEEHGRYIAPLQYHWKEEHKRVHRVVLYKSSAYFREKTLSSGRPGHPPGPRK